MTDDDASASIVLAMASVAFAALLSAVTCRYRPPQSVEDCIAEKAGGSDHHLVLQAARELCLRENPRLALSPQG